MGCRSFLMRCAGLAAVGLAGCSWPGHLTINMPAQQQQQPMVASGDRFAPLQGCAQQRGWATERLGDLVQVRMDAESMLQYHYDMNHNMVMSVRFLTPMTPEVRAQRSEMWHERGNEIYQCAGYGMPMYVGVQDSPPPQMNQPAPVMYSAQPTPRPMSCDRLNDCYRDMGRMMCGGGDSRCMEEYHMHNEEVDENNCRNGMHRMQQRFEEMSRQRNMGPMPGTCVLPGEEPMAQGTPGPVCAHLNDCLNDLRQAACRANDPHCTDRFQMIRHNDERQCQIMIDEMGTHVADEIRRNHPGFVMPQHCLH